MPGCSHTRTTPARASLLHHPSITVPPGATWGFLSLLVLWLGHPDAHCGWGVGHLAPGTRAAQAPHASLQWYSGIHPAVSEAELGKRQGWE